MRHVQTAFFLATFLLFSAIPASVADLPVIRVGYIFTTNHTPLKAAISQGPKLVVEGYSLAPAIPKEKYTLNKGGKSVALLDILVVKSGSKTSALSHAGTSASGRMRVHT